MPSKPTHEQRARRYLQASMSAGYAHQHPDAKHAARELMNSHERAYARVREHALAGADRDFDEPLTPGEREHQRELRRQDAMQQRDVERIRQELRGTTPPGSRGRAGAPTRKRSTGERAGRAAATTSAAAITAATTGKGSTGLYLAGVFLLLCLAYLLINEKGGGVKAFAGGINLLVGSIGSFIQPVDPVGRLENALALEPIDGAEGKQPPAATERATAPLTSPPGGGLPKAARAKLDSIAKAEHWSIPDWLAVIGKESGGNPFAVNKGTGAYGIGQINPEDAANPLKPRAGSTASHYPKYKGNAIEQIEAMAEYIKANYGTPAAALASENTRGWY
jgi:hypothetical protein